MDLSPEQRKALLKDIFNFATAWGIIAVVVTVMILISGLV